MNNSQEITTTTVNEQGQTITDSIVNTQSDSQGITDNVVNITENKGIKKNPVYSNLDILSTEEARKRGRAGGKKSAEVRKARKTMRETLQDALTLELSPEKLEELGADMSLMNGNTSVLSAIIASTIREAINGDTKAIQFVRDSIGEQPKQEIEQTVISKEDIELLKKSIVS